MLDSILSCVESVKHLILKLELNLAMRIYAANYKANELGLKYEFGPNIDAAVWKLTTIRYQTSS